MTKYNPFYDMGEYRKAIAILFLVSLAMKILGGSGFGIVIPFMFAAIFQNKGKSLFFWLLVSIAMISGNPKLIPKSGMFGYMQRGMLMIIGMVMATKIFGGRMPKPVRILSLWLVYIFYMFIPSAQGWCPWISNLKLVLYIVVFGAYIGIAKQVCESKLDDVRHIRATMLAFASFFIFGSVALIFIPSIGMMSHSMVTTGSNLTSLFMGMTSHSQSLGPLIASLSVILFADMLFSIRKADKLYVALLLCCPILIYMTKSRTGMGSYGMGMLYVMFLFVRTRGVTRRWKAKITNVMFVIVALMIAAAMASGNIRNGIKDFVVKGDSEKTEVSKDQILSSRQGKIDNSLEEFRKKPMIGNGFQVSPEMAHMSNDAGIVMSAPVEKGVWIYAVLEEGGVIGLIIASIFFICAIGGLAKIKAYVASASLMVLMMTNLGEFSMCSLTYTGGTIWAMVVTAAIFDHLRLQGDAIARRQNVRMMQWNGMMI